MLLCHGVADRADGIDKVVIARVVAADIVDLFVQFRSVSRRCLAFELLDDRRFLLLGHKSRRFDGIDEDVINRTLTAEAARLAQQEDSLVTNFIVENFDNVLGPGVFMMMTSGYPYPVLTPQIEDIMSKATKKFKDDPYVKQYYQTANEIQARQNGLVDDTPQAAAPTQVVPDTQQQVADSMAAPSLNIPQK